jgi:hypothetical protein
MPNIIYGNIVGEFGKDNILTAKDSDGNIQDLSGFSTVVTRVRSPKGRQIYEFASTFVTTGADGKFAFCFSSTQYPDVPGDWEATAKFESASQIAKSYVFIIQVEPSV